MKKHKTILLLVILSTSSLAMGQEVKLKLYGERNNDVVQLAWIPEHWPKGMSGVIVKKKSGNEAWQSLTASMIVPSSVKSKDLSNVESSAEERQRLSDKLDSLISIGKAREVSKEEYLDKILQDDASSSAIAFIFALDYDLILLNGFGFTDRNIDVNKSFDYGLFPVIEDEISQKPVVVFVSPAGANPNLDIQLHSKVEVVGDNKKIRLHWQFDLDKFRKLNIKGFNIYEKKQGTQRSKLNKDVIWITSNDNPADLNYLQDFPEANVEFFAAPVSYFGYEAKGQKIEFRPANYNIDVPAPILGITLENEQANLAWQMDHGYDSLIQEYSILKKAENEEYRAIDKVESKTRNYKTPLNKTGDKSRYKIVAITVTGKEIWSNESILSYVPQSKIPAPKNLTAKLVQKDESYFIELRWEVQTTNSSMQYRIFTDGPDDELIYDSSYPKDLQSPFEIEVYKSRSQLRHFAIQARAEDRSTSMLSNEVEILTPSKSLPPISISKIEIIEDQVKLAWDFNKEIADLKGFRILLDGNLLLTEDEVFKDLRSILVDKPVAGKHALSIIAVTTFELEGRPSTPRNFLVK
jgi:hypothetical protein